MTKKPNDPAKSHDIDKQKQSASDVPGTTQQLQEALEEQRKTAGQLRLLATIVTNSNDAITTKDLDGNILTWNRGAEWMYGYSEEEALKMNVVALVPEEMRAQALQIIEAAKNGQEVISREVKRRTKDGRIIDVWVTAMRLVDDQGRPIAVATTERDISEKKKLEKELRESRDKLEERVRERTAQLRQSEQNFRNSIENSPLGIRIVTAEGETLYANRSLLNMYGYSTVDELKNTPVSERYTPESYTEHLERKAKRKQGMSVPESYEISIIRKDGVVRQLRVYRRQIIWADRMEYQSIYEDVTEYKHANDMLKALSRRLIQIQEEERTNIARELHDQIGQSLNIVKMLLDRASSADGKDRQDLLDQAMPQLAELIDRVGMLSLDLRPKILDDLGLVKALEWYFDRFTTQTNVKVQFESPNIEKNLDAQIINSVYRVVQEALTNVARHAHATMVTVDLKAGQSAINLRIEDDGVGFDPAALPASSSGGIIGMQERINLVGGTLQIQGEPGAGTRIAVEIPYQSEGGKEERQG